MKARVLRMAVLGALLGIFFFWLAVRNLDWTDVRAAFERGHPWPWLPLSIGAYLLGHVVRGWRCARLVRPQATLTLGEATGVVVAGYAVNNIVPLRGGEVVRALLLSRRSGAGLVHAVAVTALERLLDGLALLAVVTLAMGGSPPAWAAARLTLALTLFVSTLAVALIACASPGLILALVARLGARLGARARFVDVAARGLSALAPLRDPPEALRVLAASLVIWLLEAAMFLFLFPLHGLPAQPWHAGVIMGVTNLGLIAPLAPGHVGLFHYLCAQAMIHLGSTPAVANAYALTVQAAFLVPISLWGLAVLWWFGLSLDHGVAIAPGSPAATASPFLRALCEALAPGDGEPARLEATTRFLAEQLAALPLRLRFLFQSGMSGARLLIGLVHFRPFERLPLAQRRAIVVRWAASPFALVRQLLRPVKSIVLLAWYEVDAR